MLSLPVSSRSVSRFTGPVCTRAHPEPATRPLSPVLTRTLRTSVCALTSHPCPSPPAIHPRRRARPHTPPTHTPTSAKAPIAGHTRVQGTHAPPDTHEARPHPSKHGCVPVRTRSPASPHRAQSPPLKTPPPLRVSTAAPTHPPVCLCVCVCVHVPACHFASIAPCPTGAPAPPHTRAPSCILYTP
jgi:hypothetical protein